MPYTRFNNKRAETINFSANAIRSMEAKIYSGDAVAATETVSKDGTVVSFVSKDYKDKHWAMSPSSLTADDTTEYTCRFGYNEGHPCMFITFKQIASEIHYNGFILCLETEHFNASPYGRFCCINVFEKKSQIHLNMSNQNITWMYMSDIQTDVEYCIYIVASEWGWHHNMFRFKTTRKRNQMNFPEEWEVRLNVRPTIRCYEDFHWGQHYAYFQKALQDFTYVKYPISSEKKI